MFSARVFFWQLCFTSVATPRERKHLFPSSSSKSPRIHCTWTTLGPCTCPSCSDHWECSSPLFHLSQTCLPLKSCLRSIAATFSFCPYRLLYFFSFLGHLFSCFVSNSAMSYLHCVHTRPASLADQSFISCLSFPSPTPYLI